MTNDCPLLRELDAWFSLALDLLSTQAAVRRDVLLLLGGAATVDDVVLVTRDDCETVAGHLLVFPPNESGRSLPLTPAFLEVTELTVADWPVEREDPAADARAVENAIATIDAALVRLTGHVRPTGAERLTALRMHSWRHELGDHVEVLTRCYGDGVLTMMTVNDGCPMTHPDLDAETARPEQDDVTAVA